MEEQKVYNVPLIEVEIDEVLLALKYCDKLDSKEKQYLINRFRGEMKHQNIIDNKNK